MESKAIDPTTSSDTRNSPEAMVEPRPPGGRGSTILRARVGFALPAGLGGCGAAAALYDGLGGPFLHDLAVLVADLPVPGQDGAAAPGAYLLLDEPGADA